MGPSCGAPMLLPGGPTLPRGSVGECDASSMLRSLIAHGYKEEKGCF